LRAECGPSHAGEAGAALTHPLEGTGLPPPLGSPAARNSRMCSPALAVGEKAHRSTIMPPSPIAMTRNGCDLPVSLKYNDLYFGAPVPTVQNSRSPAAGWPYQTLAKHWEEPRMSGDSSLVLTPMSLDTSLPLNSRATRKQCKSSTVAMSRNGTCNRKPRCGLGSGAVHPL
jgi:hypothetical protein